MLLWLQGRTVTGTPRVATVLTSPPSLRTHLQGLVTTDYRWVIQSQEWLTNINILLTISIHHHTTRLWELLKWQPKGKCFDFFCQILPTNFFRKKDGDQTWEFRITIRFWETDHLPLPWAKCCLRGGVGDFVNIRDERGNDGFNRSVVVSAFVCFVIEKTKTEIIVRITCPVIQTFLCSFFRFWVAVSSQTINLGIL